MVDLQTKWGAGIAARRAEHGMTQRELAMRIATTQQHLSRIETGAISPGDDLRIRIADAFGLSVEDVFPYAPAAAS